MSKNIKNSPLKFNYATGLIGGGMQVLGAIDWGGKRAAETKAAQEEYNTMRNKWMGQDTSNLYSDVSNPYANMENVYEDLTVNQQQAQFERQMAQQQQSNIMRQMGGAAGGSGIAGLAQAMANQGAIQAQRASVSIGEQEQANQLKRAQMAGSLQQQERAGEWKADMTRRAGQEQSRTLEAEKVSDMFTMATNRLGTAKQAQQDAQAKMWEGVGTAFSPTAGSI